MTTSSEQRGLAIFFTINVLLVVSILVAGLVAFVQFTRTNPLSPAFLEKEPPQIVWLEEPLGIGADPLSLRVRVRDSGAGLDEIVIRISQRNQPKELLKRQVRSGDIHEQEIEVALDPKALELKEGNAELQIVAFDRTLWNNGSNINKTVQVDFIKPRIEVITPEQNAVAGGTELVFYKVLGKSIDRQGVDSGANLYGGFPAKSWDQSFKSYDRIYFAFFPIPPTYNENATPLKIVARDAIGNSAAAPFRYRVRRKRWSHFTLSLDNTSAVALRERLSAYARESLGAVTLSDDVTADLRKLTKILAQRDEATLSEALSVSDTKRFWTGPFGKPVPGYPSNAAGDQRTIKLGEHEIARSTAQGAHFSVSTRTNVSSAHAGKVVLVGDLGLLGKTVVVDHGCGISTVYAHLSETAINQGALVSKGDPVGRTGSSGLSVTEGVYFEIRVSGTPVTANEWWDETWVRDHIDNKVGFVLRALVGASGE